MPPSIQFSPDTIRDAAYEIIRENGASGLSARNVAKRIGSSVAPVYSSFGSMEKLEYSAIHYAKDELLKYCRKPYTELPLMNIGVGVVVFARDYPNLYRSLFIDGDKYRDILDELLHDLQVMLPTDSRLATLDEPVREKLLNSLWIFLHGQATLICSGLHEDNSDEQIIEELRSISDTLVEMAISKNN